LRCDVVVVVPPSSFSPSVVSDSAFIFVRSLLLVLLSLYLLIVRVPVLVSFGDDVGVVVGVCVVGDCVVGDVGVVGVVDTGFALMGETGLAVLGELLLDAVLDLNLPPPGLSSDRIDLDFLVEAALSFSESRGDISLKQSLCERTADSGEAVVSVLAPASFLRAIGEELAGDIEGEDTGLSGALSLPPP